MGTVTLWSPLKSSEFRAISWLLSAGYDHETNLICGRLPRGFAGLANQRARLGIGTFEADLGGLSCHKIPEQLDRISIQRAGNCNKFNDINATLAAFVFGNK
ncbi:hypothetical protein V1289_005280 [Bradyrhizobium sp. AZCC 2289]